MSKEIEMLNKARKTLCTISGISYIKIKKLAKKLRKNLIDCNVTPGGLKISANAEDERVVKICKEFGATLEPGYSRQIEDAIMKIK